MYNIVCNTNTTTNANEIKALTRVESETYKSSTKNVVTQRCSGQHSA